MGEKEASRRLDRETKLIGGVCGVWEHFIELGTGHGSVRGTIDGEEWQVTSVCNWNPQLDANVRQCGQVEVEYSNTVII
jgi:hypothetical protein